MSGDYDPTDSTRKVVAFYAALRVWASPVCPEDGEIGFETPLSRNRFYRPYGRTFSWLEDVLAEVGDAGVV